MASTHTSTQITLQKLSGRYFEQGQVIQVGDKTLRIDPPVARAVPAPHQVADSTESVFAAPQSATTGNTSIEMGLGYVVQNNDALQAIAHAMAGTRTTVPVPTGPLNIKPAWEVDYFRWPRLARRLLKMHFPLFDQIGNHLLSQTQPTQRRIGLCSTFAREGKTTMSICLARWAALSRHRAVLIDGDVDRPGLTICSGLETGHGWLDATESDMPLSEVMIRSVETGLTFIPASMSGKPDIQRKVLNGLCSLSFQMKYEFDMVFIDMGSIENVCVHGSEGIDLVDYVVIVRDPSRTSVGQLMDTRKILANLGMNKTVVAENLARNQFN